MFIEVLNSPHLEWSKGPVASFLLEFIVPMVFTFVPHHQRCPPAPEGLLLGSPVVLWSFFQTLYHFPPQFRLL